MENLPLEIVDNIFDRLYTSVLGSLVYKLGSAYYKPTQNIIHRRLGEDTIIIEIIVSKSKSSSFPFEESDKESSSSFPFEESFLSELKQEVLLLDKIIKSHNSSYKIVDIDFLRDSIIVRVNFNIDKSDAFIDIMYCINYEMFSEPIQERQIFSCLQY